MKITLGTLTMRNFMSYGNNETIIDFKRPGTTLIVGEDLDNTTDGKSANGTGKSTIVNAVSYALYDKAVSNISKDKLVNNINKKNLMVSLDYTVGEDSYRVVRERKTKVGPEGNKVHFYKNGVDSTRSAAETNRDIEASLGIPHELFSRIIVFSASHVPFLDLPATSQVGPNQKDFIEELFGLTALSHKAEMLKAVMKDGKSAIETKRVAIQAVEGEHERHKVQVENAVKRVMTWEDTNKQSIQNLEQKLVWADGIDIEEQQRLHARAEEIRSQSKDKKRTLDGVTSEISQLKILRDKQIGEMSHLDDATCPYCKQHYESSDDHKKHVADAALETEINLAALIAQQETARAEWTALKDELDVTESKITVANIIELQNIVSQRDISTQKIADMKTAVNPYLDPLDELENIKLPEINYDEIEALTKTLEHQEFLLKLLTKKDSFVRKALLDKSLPYLNSQLRIYLNALGLPHNVVFTHEMIAEISRFGTSLDFGNLSNGQRARVNIALSFAFRNVLQNLHSTINFCMLDEVFDFGLDTVGVQLATKLVKHKTREEGLSMFVISHRDEVFSSFDSVLTVHYSKGFSTIVNPAKTASE